jgi:hypothetical protein
MYINVTALTNASVDMESAKTCSVMPDVFVSMDSGSGLDPVLVIVLSVVGGLVLCFVIGLGYYISRYGCGCMTTPETASVTAAAPPPSEPAAVARRFLSRISGDSINYKIIPP